MQLRHWLSLGLIATLVLLTPGNSTCLPLPNGRHVHVGWTDREGHESPGLLVFQHAARERVKGTAASAAFTPGSTTALTGTETPPPLVAIWGWALPLPTVVWVMNTRWVFHRQPNLTPPLRPPRPLQHLG